MSVAVEAGVDAGFQQGLPFPAQRAGKQQPLIDEKGFCEPIQSDPLRQMAVQPKQDIPDPRVFYGRLGRRLLCLIQQIQKFQKHALGDPIRALLQIAADFQKERSELRFRRGGRDLAACAEGPVQEKTFQLRALIFPEEAGGNKDHDPPVTAGGQKMVVMHFKGAGDENIIGMGAVNISFYMKLY